MGALDRAEVIAVGTGAVSSGTGAELYRAIRDDSLGAWVTAHPAYVMD